MIIKIKELEVLIEISGNIFYKIRESKDYIFIIVNNFEFDFKIEKNLDISKECERFYKNWIL